MWEDARGGDGECGSSDARECKGLLKRKSRRGSQGGTHGGRAVKRLIKYPEKARYRHEARKQWRSAEMAAAATPPGYEE